jgi:hypothetical protein
MTNYRVTFNPSSASLRYFQLEAYDIDLKRWCLVCSFETPEDAERRVHKMLELESRLEAVNLNIRKI